MLLREAIGLPEMKDRPRSFSSKQLTDEFEQRRRATHENLMPERENGLTDCSSWQCAHSSWLAAHLTFI